MLRVPEIDQRIQILHRLKHHIPAAAPITPIRPAKRHEFFAPERRDAVPAIARLQVNLSLIKKFHKQSRKKRFLKKARKNFCELGALGREVPLIASVGGD
jgi:hypothetical protein